MLYEQVVFLQDSNADEALKILDDQGTGAALEYLKQWHYPGEHETRSRSSAGRYDAQHRDGEYIMTWDSRIGYIGLEFKIKED